MNIALITGIRQIEAAHSEMSFELVLAELYFYHLRSGRCRTFPSKAIYISADASHRVNVLDVVSRPTTSN